MSRTSRDRQLCRCGHARAAHDHLRRGTDCATCARGGCVRFRPAPRFPWSLFARTEAASPQTRPAPPAEVVLPDPQRAHVRRTG